MPRQFEYKSKQFSASSVVDTRIQDYALDVAQHKLPHIVDGLKTIHRRTLWVMYKKQYFSGSDLLNSVMGEIIKVHPVGDQSINEACTRMLQPFSMGLNLLFGTGNKGAYAKNKAGSPRYLHVGLHKLAKDLFFDGVNLNTIPMIPGEDCITLEPAYLIPRLPTSLLMASFTVGVGIKSDIFPMHFESICELVKKYAELRATRSSYNLDYSKLGKYFIPSIPILNTIRNTNDLIDQYNKGNYNAAIYLDSEVEILKHDIIIKTIPFGQSFSDMISQLKLFAKDKKQWMNDLLTGFHNGQSDTMVGHIQLTFKNNQNIFEIFRKLSPLIKYSSSITPLYNYISKHGVVVEMDPPSLLSAWYTERRASVLGGIKYDQEKESRLIREKSVKLKVIDHIDEIIKIIRDKSQTTDEALELLQQRYKLSYNQASILYNTPIGMLNKQNVDAIKKEIEQHIENCKALKENSENVDEVIYKDAEYFQKKYRRPRICKINDYNGYVRIGKDDIIQWDSIDDACRILTEFPNGKVYTYPEKFNYKFAYPLNLRDIKKHLSASKITQAEAILAYPTSSYNTLWIKDTKPVCTEGMFNEVDDDKVAIPITNKFYGISPKGKIIKCTVKELLGKSNTSRIKTDYSLIYGVPYYKEGIILLYVNSEEPDKINIVKINDNIKKILISPMGTNEFIGYIPMNSDKEYLFNYPSVIKGSYKFIYIKNIDKLIKEDQDSTIFLINRKVKRNDRIKDMIEI